MQSSIIVSYIILGLVWLIGVPFILHGIIKLWRLRNLIVMQKRHVNNVITTLITIVIHIGFSPYVFMNLYTILCNPNSHHIFYLVFCIKKVFYVTCVHLFPWCIVWRCYRTYYDCKFAELIIQQKWHSVVEKFTSDSGINIDDIYDDSGRTYHSNINFTCSGSSNNNSNNNNSNNNNNNNNNSNNNNSSINIGGNNSFNNESYYTSHLSNALFLNCQQKITDQLHSIFSKPRLMFKIIVGCCIAAHIISYSVYIVLVDSFKLRSNGSGKLNVESTSGILSWLPILHPAEGMLVDTSMIIIASFIATYFYKHTPSLQDVFLVKKETKYLLIAFWLNVIDIIAWLVSSWNSEYDTESFLHRLSASSELLILGTISDMIPACLVVYISTVWIFEQKVIKQAINYQLQDRDRYDNQSYSENRRSSQNEDGNINININKYINNTSQSQSQSQSQSRRRTPRLNNTSSANNSNSTISVNKYWTDQLQFGSMTVHSNSTQGQTQKQIQHLQHQQHVQEAQQEQQTQQQKTDECTTNINNNNSKVQSRDNERQNKNISLNDEGISKQIMSGSETEDVQVNHSHGDDNMVLNCKDKKKSEKLEIIKKRVSNSKNNINISGNSTNGSNSSSKDFHVRLQLQVDRLKTPSVSRSFSFSSSARLSFSITSDGQLSDAHAPIPSITPNVSNTINNMNNMNSVNNVTNPSNTPVANTTVANTTVVDTNTRSSVGCRSDTGDGDGDGDGISGDGIGGVGGCSETSAWSAIGGYMSNATIGKLRARSTSRVRRETSDRAVSVREWASLQIDDVMKQIDAQTDKDKEKEKEKERFKASEKDANLSADSTSPKSTIRGNGLKVCATVNTNSMTCNTPNTNICNNNGNHNSSNKSKKRATLTLKNVLLNCDTFNLFIIHLINEFSIEVLASIVEINQFLKIMQQFVIEHIHIHERGSAGAQCHDQCSSEQLQFLNIFVKKTKFFQMGVHHHNHETHPSHMQQICMHIHKRHISRDVSCTVPYSAIIVDVIGKYIENKQVITQFLQKRKSLQLSKSFRHSSKLIAGGDNNNIKLQPSQPSLMQRLSNSRSHSRNSTGYLISKPRLSRSKEKEKDKDKEKAKAKLQTKTNTKEKKQNVDIKNNENSNKEKRNIYDVDTDNQAAIASNNISDHDMSVSSHAPIPEIAPDVRYTSRDSQHSRTSTNSSVSVNDSVGIIIFSATDAASDNNKNKNNGSVTMNWKEDKKYNGDDMDAAMYWIISSSLNCSNKDVECKLFYQIFKEIGSKLYFKYVKIGSKLEINIGHHLRDSFCKYFESIQTRNYKFTTNLDDFIKIARYYRLAQQNMTQLLSYSFKRFVKIKDVNALRDKVLGI